MWILGARQRGQKIWQVSAQMTSALEELRRNQSPAAEKAHVCRSSAAGERAALSAGGFSGSLQVVQHAQAPSHIQLMPPGCHCSGSSSCRGTGWSQVGCCSLPEQQNVLGFFCNSKGLDSKSDVFPLINCSQQRSPPSFSDTSSMEHRSGRGRKPSQIKSSHRTILSTISKLLSSPQAQQRQVFPVYWKPPEKCETALTVLGHMDRKSASWTNVFQ